MKNQEKTTDDRKHLGTIYHAKSLGVLPPVYVSPQKIALRQKVVRTIATGITSGAFALLFYTYAPYAISETPFLPKSSYKEQSTHKPSSSDSKNAMVFEQASKSELPRQEGTDEIDKNEASFDTSRNLEIYIPKINARSKIIKNVNPWREELYSDALKQGVAQASGTKLPGETGRSFLFAHSTNSPLNVQTYNAVFYNLRLLDEGDEIFVSNDLGETIKYKVSQKAISQASDVSWIVDKTTDSELVLQTCHPPGTSWKRLIIVAHPVER